MLNMMEGMNVEKDKPKLCKCGCGQPVTQRRNGAYNDFINHHYIRIKNPAQSESFKKRMRGDNNPSKRPEVRERISKNLKGVYVGEKNHMKQEKYRKLFSDMWMGEKNPMYGKKHSKESKIKMSISQKKRPPETEETKIKRSKAKKGITKTEEHKRKISETFKIKKISSGKNNPFYGQRHSKETRNIISKYRKKENGMNENHPLWDEIITPLIQSIRVSGDYKRWRDSVFLRDNFTCQKCFKRGNGDLNVHHCLKSFSKIIKENNISSLEDAFLCDDLWNINNGITLCKDCHYELHYKNYKRKDNHS